MFTQVNETLTFVASENLSDAQQKFVELNATAQKVIIAPANKAIGVLLNKPLAGEHATVAISGIVKVRAGGTVSVGDYLTSAASGWATTVGSGTANDKLVLGRALTAAASGSPVAILLDKMVIVRTGGLPV